MCCLECVFFFKQKTAYEMRISDWSSDVCSSDLLEALVADGVLVSITAGSIAGHFGKDAKRFAEGLLRDGLAQNVASDAHGAGSRPPGKIGRASCWERVWQYVWIPVVAVSCKQKKHISKILM